MNVEQALERLNEIRGSFQSWHDELVKDLNRFRTRLEADPTMASMNLLPPTLVYLVNSRDEELLLGGIEETISRKAMRELDHANEIHDLESDLCTLVCLVYQQGLLFEPPETYRLVARGIPSDRDERFAYWNETLRATVVAGFEIESTDEPFADVKNAMTICDCINSAIGMTGTSNSCDVQEAEPQESPTPAIEPNDDFAAAFTNVFAAEGGIATVAEIRQIRESNMKCHEKLIAIDRVWRIPPFTSCQKLGQLVGFSHSAVRKTDFWRTHLERREQERSSQYQVRVERSDGDSLA
jgi:hypothetical protein